MTLGFGDVVGGRWVGSVVGADGMSRASVGTSGKYPPPMEPERSCGEAEGEGTIGETFWEVDGLKS